MNHINRLYLHIPFCQNKCAYCAFHSIPILTTDTLISRYFTKLEKDIKESRHLTAPLQSIFIGGGTPSCLKTKYIEKLFTIISENFIIAEKAEISIESNPESLTEEKVSVIADFVNRISIGIQSFNKKHRSIIGRIGNNKNINTVIETIIKYNINMSADLIYGIPTQTIEDWKEELNCALKLPIKHLSAYALTFEEGSKLYSGKNLSSIAANDITADMWNLSSEILLQSGFRRYEISNYSLPGYECRHNLDTWFGGKYLGLGPAASSFDGKTRWTQPELNEWLKGEIPEIDCLSTQKRTIEIFIMGLRTTRGWIIERRENNSLLVSQFPHNLSLKTTDWKKISRKLSSLNKDGLLKIENIDSNKTQISPTEKGLLFWNEITMELI
jgi:oxygen-independent coproporphyrinogen III oxidase